MNLPAIFPLNGKPSAAVTIGDKRQIMEHGLAEGLTVAALARRAGVSPETISEWRLDIRQAHVANQKPKSKPARLTATPPTTPIPTPKIEEAPMPQPKPRLSREEKIAALEAQKREGLNNREAAERAGVSEQTWYAWKRDIGGAEVPAATKAPVATAKPAAPAVAAPVAEAIRQVAITRPDGTRIEVGMTAEEIRALVA